MCIGLLFLVAPVLTGTVESAEEAYPTKTIKVIAGFPAGGGTDAWGRTTATFLEKKLGVPVVVVNKPGAGSTAQLEEVLAKQPADGYTISQIEAATPLNQAKMKIGPDVRSEIAILGSLTYQGYMFGARSDAKVWSLKDFVELCKAKPGEIQVGVSSAFGTQAAIVTMFKSAANIDFKMVAYGGNAPLWKDFLGGRINFGHEGWMAFKPYIGGKVEPAMRLRPLAVAAEGPFPGAPWVPTYRDFGYDVVFDGFHGMAVHKDTPAHIVQKLRAVFKEIATSPEYLKKMDQLGRDGMEYRTPEQTQKMAAGMYELAKQLMKETGSK